VFTEFRKYWKGKDMTENFAKARKVDRAP